MYYGCPDNAFVSIHARRVTGDTIVNIRRFVTISFNSRPSCDGRREGEQPQQHKIDGFNSRPSCDGRLSSAGALPLK